MSIAARAVNSRAVSSINFAGMLATPHLETHQIADWLTMPLNEQIDRRSTMRDIVRRELST
jgi:hypothetical protein